MNFSVETSALRSTAGDFTAMAGAFPAAHAYLSHLQVDGGGQLAERVRSGVARARRDLAVAYLGTGPFPRWFTHAGVALRGIADDYDAVDAGTRQRFDELLPTPENNRSKYGLSPDDEDPGVTTADVTGELKEPGTGFEGYEQWRSVVSAVRTIADFLWLVEGAERLLAKLGWTVAGNKASDNLRDIVNVQWDSVGRVGSAVGGLSKFTDRLQDETAATTLALAKRWSGNAATAVLVSVGTFDDALARHENDLTAMQGDIRNFAYGMRYWTDFLVDVIESFGLNFPALLEDAGKAILTGSAAAAARVANVISRWIHIVTVAISGIFALCGTFALVFGQVSDYELSVPDVPPIARPDVDGPR